MNSKKTVSTDNSQSASQVPPLAAYQSAIESGQLQSDPLQHEVVGRLQDLYDRLLESENTPEPRTSKGGFFSGLFGKPKTVPPVAPVKGLYLWGGVGRGKTLLCDMFYAGLPTTKKKRVHFHRFMQGVHDQLSNIKHAESPLEIVAESIASDCIILVLDEMHVNDITDAMLMGGLLQGLFKRGVSVVTTSNIEPDDLYKDGLQRARFLPAIEAIKKHLDVVFLGGDIDYRMRLLQNAEVYRAPLDDDSDATLAAQFKAMIASGEFEEAGLIEINGRDIQSRLLADGIAWFEFDELCNTTRSTDDYIELARAHHTVLLGNVPVLNDTTNDATRRFINMIDEFYDRGVKLVITAETRPELLYTGNRLEFEFDRTISRLSEMQSSEYLAAPHLS